MSEQPPELTEPVTEHPEDRQETAPTYGTGALVRTHASAALLAFFWALLCASILDVFHLHGDVGEFFSVTVNERPGTLLMGAVVIWVLILLVAAITNHLWLSLALALATAGGLGFANLQKLEVRREPIYPSDLGFAQQGGFLVDMVGWTEIIAFTATLLALVLVVLLLGRLAGRVYRPVRRRAFPSLWRKLLLLRAVVIVFGLLTLNAAMHFNDDGNPARKAFDLAGAHWAWWSQDINYQRNGFVAGFLYNLDVPIMDVPDDYSAETMSAIAEKYAAEASVWNEGRDRSLLGDMNVVVVLSEAFSDPLAMDGLGVEGDPIPFTRSVMGSTISGRMLNQYYGGGTANMEYEVLTGLSLSQYKPQMNSPFQMLVPKYGTFPSVASLLKGRDTTTLAIHPYKPSFYKRAEVYPRLGIDRFISMGEMTHTDKIEKSDFISDDSAFSEALDHLRDTDDALFMNIVTMQNHYPMSDKYADAWPFTGETGDKERNANIGGYLRGINYSDQALERFLGELKGLDEKTAVIFYGDHHPGIWPESVVHELGDLGTRQTPFFVWTNFEQLPHEDLPTTSPIYFFPMLFDALKIELPPYYVLLRDLQSEVPALELGLAIGPDDQPLDTSSLSARASELLHDYQLVVYDFSVGERYSQSEMFYPESSVEAAP
jgi:phosphoglycerol transferase MdoB-like AlkP superfamily enzyme